MVDKKVSQLNTASPLSGAELLSIVQDGEIQKVTLDTLADFAVTARSIIPVDRPFMGAMVNLTSNYTPANADYVTIGWQEENYDVGNFWSIGAPTRFTIPAGVTKVKLSGYLRSVSGGVSRAIFFRKNGGFFLGAGVNTSVGGSDHFCSTGVVSCVAGDYFEMQNWGTTAVIQYGPVPANMGSYFSIEAVEVA